MFDSIEGLGRYQMNLQICVVLKTKEIPRKMMGHVKVTYEPN
jgi:hypothetical protein